MCSEFAGDFQLSTKFINRKLNRVSFFFHINQRLDQTKLVLRMVRVLSRSGVPQQFVFAGLQRFFCCRGKSFLFFRTEPGLRDLRQRQLNRLMQMFDC